MSTATSSQITYEGVGVRYKDNDPFKQAAQDTARETIPNLERLGFHVLEETYGESCLLYSDDEAYYGHVTEGLGTKNLIADAMAKLVGRTYYSSCAQDTVAMILNDLGSSGVQPRTCTMHLAVGSSDWFKDKKRYNALNQGWRDACNQAGCAWFGGETPTLIDMILPHAAVLSGSAEGIVRPKSRVILPRIQDGDQIVFFESSGIHANGLTLARKIGDRKDSLLRTFFNFLFPQWVKRKSLPKGYLTDIGNGEMYGEALLKPTIIYVSLIQALLSAGINIHYAVNITGHGWRKLMRAAEPFIYIVEDIGIPHPIFDFILKHGPMSEEEAYGNLNMGAGFAVYVRPNQVNEVIQIARRLGIKAWLGGRIAKDGDIKEIHILPKKITFAEETLAVR